MINFRLLLNVEIALWGQEMAIVTVEVRGLHAEGRYKIRRILTQTERSSSIMWVMNLQEPIEVGEMLLLRNLRCIVTMEIDAEVFNYLS